MPEAAITMTTSSLMAPCPRWKILTLTQMTRSKRHALLLSDPQTASLAVKRSLSSNLLFSLGEMRMRPRAHGWALENAVAFLEAIEGADAGVFAARPLTLIELIE